MLKGKKSYRDHPDPDENYGYESITIPKKNTIVFDKNLKAEN